MADKLQQAIAAIKAGDKAAGQRLLIEFLKGDQHNEAAWLWMAATFDDSEKRRRCLETVLQINPDSEPAKRGLAQLVPEVELPALEPLRSVATPSITDDNLLPAQSPPPVETRPWYYSPTTMGLTFLFLTPVWFVLILTSKWQTKTIKIIVGLASVGYLYLLLTIFAGLGVISVGGPAEIEFGSQIIKSNGDITVANKTTVFTHSISSYAEWAWITHLNRPVGTTLIRLTLSGYDAAAGEQVMDETILTVADPNYTIIYAEGSPWVTHIWTGGTFTLRVMNGNQTLAQGKFSVTTK